MNTDNDLEKLLQNLPFFIQQYLQQHPYKNELIEIVLDLGRRPEARFSHGPEYLSQKIISWQDLGHIGIKTGLPGFDNYLPSGIMPGQLGVFLAYPGIGKSWLALYFAVQAWKQGRSPLVISLEMSETEVRNRVFAIMGEGLWSHRKLSNGEVEIDMLKKWHAEKLAGKPEFHIISNDNGGDVTPSVIRGKIDQEKPFCSKHYSNTDDEARTKTGQDVPLHGRYTERIA